MDRIINNESVAICAILNALELNVEEIARLNLFTVMITDSAIRRRVTGYSDYSQLIKKESSFYQAINRKFVELQPIFLNALTMLLMGGMVEKISEDKYSFTGEGLHMALDLKNVQDEVTQEILKAAIQLNALVSGKDTASLYKDLKIVL